MSGSSRERVTDTRSLETADTLGRVFDELPHPVVLMKADGTVTYLNRAMAESVGQSEASLLGSDFLQPLPTAKRVLVSERLSELVKGGGGPSTFTLEHQVQLRDGTVRLISWEFVPVRQGREVLCVAALGRDVTKAREAEQALRRSEEFFRLLAENTRDLVFRYRLKPRPGFEYVSPSATAITGYTPDEHYADPQLGFKIVHPEDRALLEAFLRPPFDSSRPVTIRWIRKDGATIWTEMQLTPVTDSSGAVVALNGVSRDVTDRILASETLKQNLRNVAALLDSLPGYAFFKDAQGVYVMANQPFSEAVGCPKELIPGKTDFDLFPREMAVKYRRDDEKVISTGKGLYIGEEDMMRGESRIVVATRKVPVKDTTGKVVGLIGLGFDITERKQYEEELELRLRYESLLNEISSEGVRATSANQLIERSIELLGEGFGASRAYVFRYDQGKGTFSNTHEWAAAGVRSEKANLQNLPEARFPLWTRMLAKGEVVCFDKVEDVQSEADRERLLQQGVKSVVAVPLYLADGSLYGFLGLDQCDRRRKWLREDLDLLVSISRMLMALVGQLSAEAMLQESEKRYRSFFENTGSATAIIEEDMTISLVNTEFERISGYAKEEVIGRKWTEFVHKDDVARMKEYHRLRRTDPASAPRSYDFRFISRDGRLLDVRANVSMIPGTKKSIGSFFDLTMMKQAERALMDSERFLSSVFSSIQDGISVLDREFRIVRVNPTIEQWYSHAMPLVGRKCYEAFHGRNQPCESCPTIHTMDTGRTAREVVPKVGAGGGPSGWLEVYSFPQKNQVTGEVVGVIEYVRDVSESRLYEEALRKANEKLQLMGSVTRHDALNQLSVLYGWLDIVLDNVKSEPLHGYLNRMKDAADAIRSQLEFTADYQAMGVHGPSWIEVDASIARGTTGLGMETISLEKDVAGLELYCDPMLDKVFHNLVDNSIRHGGKVSTIRISYEETSDGLLLIYEDDGEGIPKEDKERVFMPGKGRHKGYGLFLARAVLGITGITIAETGVPGKGARFEIRVPVGKYRIGGQHSPQHRKGL